MAHLPTLPDPTPRRNPHGQTPSNSKDSQFSFTELTKLLGQHGAGSSSEDLALDLLLHEVVSQACTTTHAVGAAIALLRNGEFVCRATSGKHAPDLGSFLSADSGLSGACIQSRQVQRCDDTEVDTRVDAAACRRLGVRSVVVVPLLHEGSTVGILEVFSPYPQVFTDGDVETLTILSRSAMETMSPPVKEDEQEERSVPGEPFVVNPVAVQPHKDPWTTVLAILIVALALLLGWMLGHQPPRRDAEKNNALTADSSSVKAVAPMNEISSPSTPTSIPTKPASIPATIQRVPVQTAGGLEVYENGKIVFQVKPVHPRTDSIAAQIPPDAANTLLLDRVEPQYPDQARLSHIQGPVVLQIEVNEKGTVQQVRALSGDPQLVTAASDAVQHWRFKPYAPKGQALNFETQVTVDFKLP